MGCGRSRRTALGRLRRITRVLPWTAAAPGTSILRTADPQKQSKCCMEALIMHEAVPGHHLQVALAMEMTDVPEFRRAGGHTAYIEGWGLYAESSRDRTRVVRESV